MPIRVIRLMEYTYPNAESTARDMAKWVVQGTKIFGTDRKIVSTVLPFEVFEERETKTSAPAFDAAAFSRYNLGGKIGVALNKAGAKDGTLNSDGHLIGTKWMDCPHPRCVQNRRLLGLI